VSRRLFYGLKNPSLRGIEKAQAGTPVTLLDPVSRLLLEKKKKKKK
jgi:hypothetical protein